MQVQKAIILVRVSTEEQEEGHSLDAQRARLIEYCNRRRLDIIETFVIVESSTIGNRKKFMEMIQFAKRQKGVVAIVADAVDRVQRSFKDSVYLDELIRQEQIELHFFREGMVLGKNASASDVMRWDFSVMGAKSYVLQLSENVKRSLDWKIKKGECIGPAPLGYLNARDEKGRSIVIIDPVSGPLIQRLMLEYAKGIYTLSNLAKKCKEWGLRSKKGCYVGKSALFNIIQNPFYYGEMLIKGEMYQHNYEPLITKDIYMECKSVREGWNKKPFMYGEKKFLFRGILTCAVTGKTVTGEMKTRKYVNGKQATWTYLATRNPDNPERRMWVREEIVVGQVEKILQQAYCSHPLLLECAINAVNEAGRIKQQWHKKNNALLKKELISIKQKSERLLDLLAEGMVSKEDYHSRLNDYNQRKTEIMTLLSVDEMVLEKNPEKQDFEKISFYQVFHAMNDIEDKREFMNFIFKKLELKGSKLCYSFNYPFEERKLSKRIKAYEDNYLQ